MPPLTLSHCLIEEERNKQVIGSDLRFLVGIVSRACKAEAGSLATVASQEIEGPQRMPVIFGLKSDVERIVAYHGA